jgi:hypothetical protein
LYSDHLILNRPIKRVPAKESHFELPSSQYMESQSAKSRISKNPFVGESENGDTNVESVGVNNPINSPPKKIVSWQMILEECENVPISPALHYLQQN